MTSPTHNRMMDRTTSHDPRRGDYNSLFEEDLTATNLNEEIPPSKKQRTEEPSVYWMFDKACPEGSGGDENKHSTDWSIYRTHKTQTGAKKYYRCNRVKLRDEPSEAAMYLLYNATEEKVIRLRTSDKHRSPGIVEQGDHTTLPPETKAEIEKLYNSQVKPGEILETLTKIRRTPMPVTADLNSYLEALRKDQNNKQKSGKVDFGELSTSLMERSIISSNEHASFVVAYEISSSDCPEPSVRFVISTKHLLGLACRAKIFHASAAFNLTWRTFSIYVMGSTDKDNQFHPFGLLASTQSQREDFRFFFKALHDAAQVHKKGTVKPSYLLCNSEPLVEKSFTEVFGPEVVILTCWAHARKHIIKLALNFVEPNHRVDVINDIDTLQLADSNEVFLKASEYFLQKWQHEGTFCRAFKRDWLDKNSNWFEGAANGFASTNQALEDFIVGIRNGKTLRVRFTIENFLAKVLDMVSDWSNAYKMKTKYVVESPTISHRLWLDSYQWSKMPKSILKCGNKENFSCYRVPAKENLTSADRVKTWSCFESYKRLYFNECFVTLPLEREGWLRGRCSCPTFFKTYMCKHILGMAITLKEVRVPREVRNEMIDDSHKKPRPLTGNPDSHARHGDNEIV